MKTLIKPNQRVWCFACVAAIAILSVRVAAETLVLPALEDGFIRASQSAAQTNNTVNQILLVGNTATANDYLRGVFSFDLTHGALAGATIHSVHLDLSVNARDTSNGGSADAARRVDLHALDASFTEAAVSWTSRDGITPWATQGGDFGPLLGSVTANPGTVNAGDTLTFSTGVLTTAVRGAVGGSLLLLAKLEIENDTRAVFRFDSGENTSANPPRLVIDYTPEFPPDPPPLSAVTPLPGHPERFISTRYALTAGGRPVEVKSERFSFDVALFTLASNQAAVVEIAVTEDFDTFTLKPDRHNLAVTRTGNTLAFTLAEPLRLVLQIPGRTPLAILVTPPEVSPPAAGDPDVIYFGPGTTVAGVIRPLSHQTVYLAPGALVKGRIEAKNVSHVAVKGRGFLETQGYSMRSDRTMGILFENATDITVEGIGVRSYYTFWQTLFLNSRSVSVAHVNLFGLGVNTDGVDIDAVKDFVVRDSLIRAEDDGLGWHSLDAATNGELITERVVADNVVIWNTGAGNGVRIGASMEAQLWRDVTLRRIDILQHAVAGLYSDYSDWGWMRNLRFEDIAIERATNPIIFQISKTIYSNSTGFLDERGHFDGLVFRNVTAKGGTIKLSGYDATHRIHGVRFINCVNGGVPLVSADQLTLNAHVTDLAFDQELPAPAAPAPGVHEAEDLETLTPAIPQYVVEDAAAGQGRVRVFLGSAPGDFLEHTIDSPTAGIHRLKVRTRLTASSGRAQLTLNGAPVGGETDFHSTTSGIYQEFDFGEVTLPAAGPQTLRFTVTGSAPASTGHRLDVDAFKLLTPLEAWRDRHFLTTANTGPAADTADPDHDGTPNLLEYASGSPPLAAQPPTIAVSTADTGGGRQLVLAFTRLEPAVVTFVVQASDNLVTWVPVATLSPGTGPWTGSATVDESDMGDGLRRVSVATLPAPAGRRFLRLTLTPP